VDGGGTYTRVTPQRLAAILRAGDVTLVNVHVPYAGEIAGTDRFIPYDRIGERLAELPGLDQPVILYCRSGRMSAIAASELVGRGYRAVVELAGGMEAWQAAGFPLLQRTPPSP
jgi:rhodanese-related sulfurtransferase